MIELSIINPLVRVDLEDPLPAALSVWRDAVEGHDPRERELATELCRAAIYRTMHELEAFGRGRCWDRGERARIEDSLRYELTARCANIYVDPPMLEDYSISWRENYRAGGVWTIEISVLEQPRYGAMWTTLTFYVAIN